MKNEQTATVSKKSFIRDLWLKADEELYNSVNVRRECARNGIAEQTAADWINDPDVPMEYGVSAMQPWFYEEPEL